MFQIKSIIGIMISNEKKDCFRLWEETGEKYSPNFSADGLYKLSYLDSLISSSNITTQFVIVYNVASLEQQELFFSTLEKINKKIKTQTDPSPIVILIGDNSTLSFNGSNQDCVVKTLEYCDKNIFYTMMEQEASKCFKFSRELHEFDTQLEIISTKAIELRKSGHITAADTAEELYENLTKYAQTYFKNPTKEAYSTFKTSAKKELDLAHKELDKHRGWKQILGNVALAILGLGVFYLFAVMVNKNIFFNKTDSSKKLDNFEKFIGNWTLDKRS